MTPNYHLVTVKNKFIAKFKSNTSGKQGRETSKAFLVPGGKSINSGKVWRNFPHSTQEYYLES
jgi:hypothetical protein